MNEKIVKILELAFDLRKKGFAVFVSYEPHIDQIQVSIYTKGWYPKINSDYDYTIYLIDSDAMIDARFNFIIERLEELK